MKKLKWEIAYWFSLGLSVFNTLMLVICLVTAQWDLILPWVGLTIAPVLTCAMSRRRLHRITRDDHGSSIRDDYSHVYGDADNGSLTGTIGHTVALTNAEIFGWPDWMRCDVTDCGVYLPEHGLIGHIWIEGGTISRTAYEVWQTHLRMASWQYQEAERQRNERRRNKKA